MRRLSFLRRFRDDQRGATLVEFAMVAPVMGLVLLGGFDVGHTLYLRAVLQGALQKAARDSTLENNNSTDQLATIDKKVSTQALALNKNAKITFTRRFYRTFTDAAAARAETWTDNDGDGICNNGEPYEDANQNGVWDADGGNAGQGGARDTTLYSVKVSFPRLFPVYHFIGGSDQTVVSASTVLRNQPYADQSSYKAPVVRNCP